MAKVVHFPLMALALLGLLTGLWAGLVRIGLPLPEFSPVLLGVHGPLMVSGFLGTLIGLERAAALDRRWAYLAPGFTGVGTLLLVPGLPQLPGPLFLVFGSFLTFLATGSHATQHPSAAAATMTLGAWSWFAGNALWVTGTSPAVVALWWMGFPVLLIAGERLELSRVLRVPAVGRWAFAASVALFLAGALLAVFDAGDGRKVAAAGMLALAAWLVLFDIARRNLANPGQGRFMGLALLAGYAWLAAGALLAFAVEVPAGFLYDAMLHAVFLGFVFSMIFAHAPILFPALLGIRVPYTPAFYVHLGLLHVSLALRVAADLAQIQPVREWAGLLNAVAVLLFLANTAIAARRPIG